MADLSILIPARNEIFLKRTIEDILANIEGDTEIIAVLDGYWPDPGIEQHPRVTVVHLPESIGQRAATNLAARLSKAKYLMKCDAHVAFDKGFDRKLMEVMQDDWTIVPVMKNLHAFDWVCEDGHRRYQGPSGSCQECSKPTVMDVVWIAKKSPNSTSFRFTKYNKGGLHFEYWGDFKKRQEWRDNDIVRTLSLQGSCFMLTREKYWELNICDEGHGSWGQQGVEVALKTWLSGGKVMCNKNTWYAHMFRTQQGFKFPYYLPESEVEKAREYSRKLWLTDSWPLAKMKLEELLDQFKPVPEWHES